MNRMKLFIKHCFDDIISHGGPGISITRSSSSSALVNSPAVLASSSSSGSSDGGQIINDLLHHRLPFAVSALAVSGPFLYAASGPNVHVFEYDSNNSSSSQTPLLHHYSSFPTSDGAAPVKSICFSGEAFVLTAHQDGKIRVWQRQLLQSTNYSNTNTILEETASSQSQSQQHQKKQIIRYRVVAVLPTTTDRLRRFAIPHNYVQVRRHKKRLWIHHHDAVSALVLAAPPFHNNYHHRLSSTTTSSTTSNNNNHNNNTNGGGGGGAGLLYSVSWDKSLKVWRASDFKCLESVTAAHDDAVNAVAVSPDGSLVYTGSADGRIRVWAPVVARAGKRWCSSSNTRHELVATLDKHRSPINALALMMMMTAMGCCDLIGSSSSEMLLFSGACDGSILAWERENKEDEDEDDHSTRSHVPMRVAGALRGHDKAVLCLIVAGDVLVSGSADRTVRMWRRRRGLLDIADNDDQFFYCLRVMEGHRGPVKSLAVATSSSTTSTTTTTTTTTPMEDCNNKGGHVGAPVISVFSGSLDGEIRLWHFDLSSSSSGARGGGGIIV